MGDPRQGPSDVRDPEAVHWTSPYLKRLIIERFAIRAALENPGGSLILGAAQRVDTDMSDEYSSMIGNGTHLDLIDAESVLLGELNKDELRRFLIWCDGLPPNAAAEFRSTKPGTIRKRGQRAAEKVVEVLNSTPDSTVKINRVEHR